MLYVHGLKFRPKAIALRPNSVRQSYYTATFYDEKDQPIINFFTRDEDGNLSYEAYSSGMATTLPNMKNKLKEMYDDGFCVTLGSDQGGAYFPTQCTWNTVG